MNDESPTKKPLLVIVLGPTGSGKTALAVAMARRFSGEVVSCDSVAVYRGMDVGTAKPSPAERAEVPHHLLNMVDPTEPMTAGDWARAARKVVFEIAARGRMPIISGGTGLYLRAFLEGLAPLPTRCPALRTRLLASGARGGPGYLHRLLKRLDGQAAVRIHAHDEAKLLRALEVALLGAAPALTDKRDPLRGFQLLRIGLAPERIELYRRLNHRAAQMFANGLLEETRGLQTRWGADAQALGALGYRQAEAVLAGTMTEAQALSAISQGHRNYAKRQMTWFRKEPDVHWLHQFGEDATAEAAQLVHNAVRM